MFNNIYEKIKKFIKENWLFIILFSLVITISFVKVPYQVQMPGGTINLSNRIKVNGEETDIEGTFNMAYVSVVQGSIPYVLFGMINPDWEVIKDSEVKYDNETIEESNKRDKLYLEQSKDYAIITAMDAAGIDYEITNRINYVSYLSEDADTDIKIGDHIIECEGEEIQDINTIKDIITSKDPGDEIEFIVDRNGEEIESEAVIYEEDGENFVGMSVITTFDIESETNIEIDSKESESGPSGGMMMSLMVYNSITKQDLTHGKKIVGTGTIELDGTVGEIGGVKYKVMGAVKDDADIFLVPEGNYEEAIEVKKDKDYNIEIISVSNLQDAIEYLEGLYE